MSDSGVPVIDLGTARPDDPSAAEPSPRPLADRIRVPVLAVAAALVLAVGGAAPATAPPLRETLAVPLSTEPNGFFWLADDVLVVIETIVDSGPRRIRITGYDATRGRRIWSTERPRQRPQISLIPAADVLLLGEGYGTEGGLRTVALDSRTGQERWSVPGTLTVFPGERTALAREQIFPPGSRVDPDDPPPDDPVYVSDSDVLYRQPPIGLVLVGVDLATGAVRWRSPRLVDAVPLPASGDRGAVAVTRSSETAVEVRNLHTGEIRDRVAWPGDKLIAAVAAGDVVAVLHSGTSPQLSAYTADRWQPLWSRPLLGSDPFVEACGAVLCPYDATGTRVFDPVHGTQLWAMPRQTRLWPIGPFLLQLDDNLNALRTIDPWTGRTVADLSGWRLLLGEDGGAVSPTEDRPTLLYRPPLGRDVSWFGHLGPTGAPVPLEVVPYTLSGCRTGPGYVACRTQDQQLRLWRYTSPRTS